mgnify:CR=1 FL=1
MGKPLKPMWQETPILYGNDARRFLQRMKNPPKMSEERIAEIKRCGETVMSVFED